MFDLQQCGWKSFFQEQLSADAWEAYQPGRIALIHQSQIVIWSAQGEHSLAVPRCENPKDLIVGDWVCLPHSPQERVRRLARGNELVRWAPGGQARRQPFAANVDTLVIVSSCDNDFSESRIERYLALAAEARIRPVIVLTKADLTDKADDFKQVARVLGSDIQIECVDARAADHLVALQDVCPPGQTAVLMGASGVGKSTLINSLADADQATFEVSAFDGKGRHSTTARSLHPMPGGGLLLDTPGTRDLQLADCATGIDAVFPEVIQFAEACRFNNCQHHTDAGCAIRDALKAGTLNPERWQRYQQLQIEQAQYFEAMAAGAKKKRKPRKR
ncbi:ribosome small subunit-dependent GTPase A [Planctomycetota bacterium]